MVLEGILNSPGKCHNIVSEYSRLDLSYAKDKLPAISGIAKQLKSTSGPELGDYLAGLWERNIELDLLWHVTGSSPIYLRRPHPRSAPSWSWASVGNQIVFEDLAHLHRSSQHSIKILEHNIVPTGPDIFGELRLAYLTISGIVTTGPVAHKCNKQICWTTVKIQDISMAFFEDYSLREAGDGFVPPGEIFFLMMGIDFNPTHKDAPFSLFLALRCVNPAINHFERIGICHAPKKHFDEDWMKAQAERVIVLL